jgi:four helix bundle protein
VVSLFEDLKVFQRSYALALQLHKITLTFPDYEKFALATQIRRASKSIPANIVEGYAKQSKFPAEFKRFLFIAIGSSEEMKLWLMFCKDLEYINQENYKNFYNEYDEVSKMLHGLIKNWRE